MAEDLLALGRRNLICGEIAKAVDSIQEACALLATQHGDTDKHLAEPNLLYGTALLELARMEATVLGNALEGVPEDDGDDEPGEFIEAVEQTEEEHNKMSEDVIDAMCSNADEGSVTKEETTEKPDEVAGTGDGCDEQEDHAAEADDNEESVEEETEHNEESVDTNGCAESSADKDEQALGEADDEDISNLQLAWEVIEVAKNIYAKESDDESKLKVAECHSKLAEVLREQEEYEAALTELKDCLSVRTAILSPEHREIAEVHYQLGTTYHLKCDFDNAKASFHSASICLSAHSNSCREKLAGLESASEPDASAVESAKAAISEVNALVDAVEKRCREVEEDIQSLASAPSTSTQNGSVTSKCDIMDDKPTDDISHLVRRKRPSNEKLNGGPVASNGTNGHAAVETSPKTKKLKTDEQITVAATTDAPLATSTN